MEEDEDLREVTFDYTDQNDGKTHLLVVEFPEGVGERAFLIALKFYLTAQHKAMQRNVKKKDMN